MADSDFIFVPQTTQVAFDVDPAYNALHSILILNQVDELSGFGEWVVKTTERMTPEQRKFNKLLTWGFKYLLFSAHPPTLAHSDLQGYIDDLGDLDPQTAQMGIARKIHSYALEKSSDIPDIDAIISDRDAFQQVFTVIYDNPDAVEFLSSMFDYLTNPPHMISAITDHLQMMWTDYGLRDEWIASKPIIEESVEAFSRLDFGELSLVETLKAVTGRDLTDAWDGKLAELKGDIICVPSTHIGPYVALIISDKIGEPTRLMFGARLPRESAIRHSALGRAELLTRLNALSDNTRLQILELLTENDELCAQDIITMIGMSQSSVSRHLSQLAATGYITQRRKDVAKCYSLNHERISDTLQALKGFLAKK